MTHLEEIVDNNSQVNEKTGKNNEYCGICENELCSESIVSLSDVLDNNVTFPQLVSFTYYFIHDFIFMFIHL